jgi:hypothetical protein
VDWTDAFLEGRALWLSAFPGDQPEATRESCQLANRWVEQFCQPAPIIGTNFTAKELRERKKPGALKKSL